MLQENPGLSGQPSRGYIPNHQYSDRLSGGHKHLRIPTMPTIGGSEEYQIPACYYALRAIARREEPIPPKIGEVEITPGEVIEEARTSDSR